MSLALLIQALASDLSRNLPRNTVSFAEVRARRPELASFATVGDVRLAMDPASPLAVAPRRALVTAVVEEAQRGASPVWPSLLVLAFAPMLHRLRKVTSPRREDDELDSAILAAFLGAIRSVRPGRYTSLALRWATEREVKDGRRRDGRLGLRAAFDERIHSSPVFHEILPDRSLEAALRVLEQDGAAEILDVLIATRGRDESLRAYVGRTCSNPHERASRYEHLCRARLRLERELRERIPAPVAA